MVVIKEENTPPTRWKLGRITKVVPGSDGLIRVAEVQTQSGIIKRPISKLCQLPLQTELVEENKSIRDKSKYNTKLNPSTTFFLVIIALICGIVGDESKKLYSTQNSNNMSNDPFKGDPGIYFNSINHGMYCVTSIYHNIIKK